MRVGIPTETKNNEFRVAITPAGVAELTRRGHEVLIQAGAGEGSAITDADFKAAGAQLVGTADQVWADADLLLKVKEPIAAEYGRLRHGQICSRSCIWPRHVLAPMRCWIPAPRQLPTRPSRPPTAHYPCLPR